LHLIGYNKVNRQQIARKKIDAFQIQIMK